MVCGQGCFCIEILDKDLDNFVNNWFFCQVYYYGDVNCFIIDLQMCNYFQDNMGMNFIKLEVIRKVFIIVVLQQEESGVMFDGIFLVEGVEFKYINQIFYIDYCVWLFVIFEVYLVEIGDYGLFQEKVCSFNGDEFIVFERFSCVMDWFLRLCDECGFSYIV